MRHGRRQHVVERKGSVKVCSDSGHNVRRARSSRKGRSVRCERYDRKQGLSVTLSVAHVALLETSQSERALVSVVSDDLNMAPVNGRVLRQVDELQRQNELLILFALYRTRRRRSRNVWVRQVFLEGAVDGDFHYQFAKLKATVTVVFHNFVRMSPQQFDFLENMVRPYIDVQRTHLRPCLLLAERLANTLR